MLGVPYFLAFAIAVAAIGAWYDWRTGHIPDWVTVWPLGLAPLAHIAVVLLQGGTTHDAIKAAGFSILGAVACAFTPIVLYRASGGKAIGGGDLKLLAALGAILRPMAGIEAEFYAFFAAMLIAPARLAYEGKLFRVLGNTLALALNPFLPKHRRRQISPEMMTSMRFGPAIFVGTCGAALTQWRTP
jgi:prepilin peptidase CpaA